MMIKPYIYALLNKTNIDYRYDDNINMSSRYHKLSNSMSIEYLTSNFYNVDIRGPNFFLKRDKINPTRSRKTEAKINESINNIIKDNEDLFEKLAMDD